MYSRKSGIDEAKGQMQGLSRGHRKEAKTTSADTRCGMWSVMSV